nr:unnamed protein product [Digitaria exilis]CAB3483675.1 unnamed protein product [Digitaria exilis]
MPGLEVAASALALANSTLEGFLKISAQLGADTDLAFIRDEFAMMQAFLKTAEKSRRSRPKRGKVMNTWVRQVRSLAHDVEDCLEDSTLHLDRRLRRRQSSSSLRFFFLRLRLLPRKLKARHRIAGDIKKLRARVEELSGRNVRYRLIDDVAPPASSSSLQPPADRQLLITRGRHDQMWSGGGGGDQRSGEGSLADLIAGGGDGIRVISVWGRDDHGRASISVVKEAYDDDDLGGGFTWRAWVKVTHPFSPNEFVRSLVVQFHAATSIQKFEAMSKMEKTMMAEPDGRPSLSLDEEFVMLVKENKYIFVLDDLADVEEWIWIKTYLLRPDLDKNGSRIVY